MKTRALDNVDLSRCVYKVVHRLPDRVRVRIPAIHASPELAAGLERMLRAEHGVGDVKVNADCASATIHFDPAIFDPVDWLNVLNVDSIPRVARSRQAAAGGKKLPAGLAAVRRTTFSFEQAVPPPAQLIVSATSLLAALLGAPPVVTGAILSLSTAPILNRAVQTVLDERRLGADALDGMTCLLLIRQSNFIPAGVMTFLIALGEFVRDRITTRCQDLIAHQLALVEHSVWLVKGTTRIRTPLAKLNSGDKIVIYPGEIITCEGKVISGGGNVVSAKPEVDFAPQVIQEGDRVTADTLLTDGKLYVRFDTCIDHRPLDAIKAKQNRRWLQRTRLHRQALREGYDRVWLVLAVAGSILALTRDLNRAMAIICFDFLTGVRIAVPTAALSSVYKAGKHGIVIRNASSLERLAHVDVVVFARSGALTNLSPAVTEVFTADDFDLETVTRYAAALEQRYHHLAAHAISSYANVGNLPVPERHKVQALTGLGITGEIEGHDVLIGSTRLMKLRNVDLAVAQAFLDNCKDRGDSRACVAIDGKLGGVIAYQDPLRPDVPQLVQQLKALGVKEIAMTTGASKRAAKAFAQRAGIPTVYARTLPEDKAAVIREYRRRGHTVAVVGFDVADAPALEQADVAITLSTGADVAKYRADIVLTSQDLTCLITGMRIARDGMSLARQNMVVVSVPNWLGLGISMLDRTDVLANTILNNGSVILGALNGLRPLLRHEQSAAGH